MPTVRLLADDLTGALDTAAEFVGLCGPVHAFLDKPTPGSLPPSAAIDTGTREAGESDARDAVGRAVGTLRGAEIAFKKLDSLLRGQTLPELAAVAEHWTSLILAPAFPFQGRTTQGGQQFAAGVPAGPNLVGALRAHGAYAARIGDTVRPGIAVFDAATDGDLDALVTSVGRDAPVLWCGTGGLARALAGAPPPCPALPRPILGLFGSDQAVTAAQLAQCGGHWTALRADGDDHAAHVFDRLDRNGVVLASLDLPFGTARQAAADVIARTFTTLVRDLPKPGTLAVAGGETLRALCLALETDRLVVRGRAMPGVPISTMAGGRWDGVTVLSKSGAFGPPTLLRDLLLHPERISA